MRRSVQPVAVRKYLSAKLADFEHEVFAVLFLDTQHRLIEYSELFRGMYPRELVKEALRLNAVNQRPIVSRCQRPNFSSCSG